MDEVKKIKVKVKSGITGFYDFYSRTDIYPREKDQVFEVLLTPFISQKLSTGELILVSEEAPKKGKN